MGSAKVIQPVIQLDLSFCPIPFLPSLFHSVDSKGSPDKHPSTKLKLSLHSREPACIRKHVSENIPVLREYFYLKITGYTCTYNILKPLNKIQNGGNKDFLFEYQTHNLMLSGQNEIKLYINNKRKLLC